MSKKIIGSRAEKRTQEIRIAITGKGGAKGQAMIQNLVNHIEYLKTLKTTQQINDQYCVIIGYCRACVDAEYIDKEGADELMQLAAVLTGIETERAQKEARQ